MPEFDKSSYDVLLDKGTMDAILCGKDAFGSFADALAEIYRSGCQMINLAKQSLPPRVMSSEEHIAERKQRSCMLLSSTKARLFVDRVLRVGGIFILITYGGPSHRLVHLRQNHQCPFQIVLYILSRAREGIPDDNVGSSASSDETELSSPEVAEVSSSPVTKIVGPFDAGVMDLHEVVSSPVIT